MDQYQLVFSNLHNYDPGKLGITVPVILRSGLVDVEVETRLDTGSTFCVFERGWGEELGFDIEGGHLEIIGTPMGTFRAYGHPVTLSVLEFDFEITAYFAADPSFNRNVLGRHGFLDRVQLGLVDYEGRMYLSRFGGNGGQ
jgi:hypothetical protein